MRNHKRKEKFRVDAGALANVVQWRTHLQNSVGKTHYDISGSR
jgi:hypothetical protein